MIGLWRHKKRGTTYEILHDRAVLQCSSEQKFEDMFSQEVWTVYRDIHSGSVYLRPTKEFLDGRFEKFHPT